MLEISERGHERRQEGGIGRAIGNIMESWKCLQEDMETLFDEMENMGERGGSYGGDRSSMGYRGDYDDYYRVRGDMEERMGERRGVKGTGRYSRYR